MLKLFTIPLSMLCILSLTACNTAHPNRNKPSDTISSPAQPLAALADSLLTEADCRANQGSWEKVGKRQQLACILPTSDAGKSCTDGKQCQTACVLKDQKVAPGTAVKGQCHESTLQFGCRTHVTHGKAEATLCID